MYHNQEMNQPDVEIFRKAMQWSGTINCRIEISQWFIDRRIQRELQSYKRAAKVEKEKHWSKADSEESNDRLNIDCSKWNKDFITSSQQLRDRTKSVSSVRSPQMAHKPDWRRPGHSIYSIESEYKIHDYSMDICRIWDFDFGTKSNVYEIAVTFCTSCIQTDDSILAVKRLKANRQN
jgi:hypothetical protein